MANACHDDEDEDEDEESKQRDQTREEEGGNGGKGDTSNRPSLFRIESVVAAKKAAKTASLKSLGAASEALGSKRSSRSRVTIAVEGPGDQTSPGSRAAGIGPSGFVMPQPQAVEQGTEAASSDGHSSEAGGDNKEKEGEEEEDDEGPVGFIAPNALSSQPSGAVDFFGVQRPASAPPASSTVGFVPPQAPRQAAAVKPGQEDAVRASAESAGSNKTNGDEEGPVGFVSPHLLSAPAAAAGPVDFFGIPCPAAAPVMPSKVDSKAPVDTARGFSMPQKGPEAGTEDSKEVVRESMESVNKNDDDDGPMGFIAPHLLPGPPAGPVDFFGVQKPVAASQEEEALRDWISSRSEEPKEAAPEDSVELETTNKREPRHQMDSLRGTQGSFQRDAVIPDSEPGKPSSKGAGHEEAVRASTESVGEEDGPMGFIAPHLLPGPPAGPVDFFGVQKPVAASQEEEALRDWISSRSEEPKGFVPPKEAAGYEEAARASLESAKSEENGPVGFIAPHALSAPPSAGPVDFFGVQQPLTASQELRSLPKVNLSPEGTQDLQQQQQPASEAKKASSGAQDAVRGSAESLRSNKSEDKGPSGFIAPQALSPGPAKGPVDFFGVQKPVTASQEFSELPKVTEDKGGKSYDDVVRMSMESVKSNKSEEGPSGFIAPSSMSAPSSGVVDFFGVQKAVRTSQELSELPKVTERPKPAKGSSGARTDRQVRSSLDKGGESYEEVVRMSMESVKSNKSNKSEEEGPSGFIAPSAVSAPASGVVDFFGVQKPVRTSQEFSELPKVSEMKASSNDAQLRSPLEDKGGKSYDDVVRMSMESVKSNKSEEGPTGFIAPSAVLAPSSGVVDFFGVQKPVMASQEFTELPKVTETKPAKADGAQLRSSLQGMESGQPSSRGATGYEDAVRASMESLKSNKSEEGGSMGFIAPHALSPPPSTTVDFFGVQQPVRASQELDLPQLLKTESSEILQSHEADHAMSMAYRSGISTRDGLQLQQSGPSQESNPKTSGAATGFVPPKPHPRAAAEKGGAAAAVLVASSTRSEKSQSSPTSPPPPPAVPCFGIDQSLQKAGAATPKFGTGDGRRAVPPSSIDFSGSSRPFQINSTSPGSSVESEKAGKTTVGGLHTDNGSTHVDQWAAAREVRLPTQTPPLDPDGSRTSRLHIDPRSAPSGRTHEQQYSPSARGRFMTTDSSAFVFPRSEGRAAGTAGRPTLSARTAESSVKPVSLFNAMHASSPGASDSSYSRSAALNSMSSSYRERRYYDAPSGHHQHHQHQAMVEHPPSPRGQQTVSEILKDMQPYSRSPSTGLPSSLVSANGVFSSASRAAVISRDATAGAGDRDAPLSSYGGRRRPAFPRDVFADNPLFSSTR